MYELVLYDRVYVLWFVWGTRAIPVHLFMVSYESTQNLCFSWYSYIPFLYLNFQSLPK